MIEDIDFEVIDFVNKYGIDFVIEQEVIIIDCLEK